MSPEEKLVWDRFNAAVHGFAMYYTCPTVDSRDQILDFLHEHAKGRAIPVVREPLSYTLTFPQTKGSLQLDVKGTPGTRRGRNA